MRVRCVTLTPLRKRVPCPLSLITLARLPPVQGLDF
jgi:hypothetical protein